MISLFLELKMTVRAIQSIRHTAQPLIDTIADSTGLNVFLTLGGPIPEREGKLGFIQYVFSAFLMVLY